MHATSTLRWQHALDQGSSSESEPDSDDAHAPAHYHAHSSGINAYDPGVDVDGSPGGMHALSAIRMFLPDGEITTPAAERYELCPHTGLQFGKHPQVSPADRQHFKDMVMGLFDSAFAKDMNDLPGYNGDLGPVQIQVISDKVVFSRPRKQSQLEKEIADKKCTEMRDAGIIEPAPRGKYASCATVAAKKASDGTWSDSRYCIDYRQINQITSPHNTRFPLADEIFQELGDCQYFTKLDMRSGFFQLKLHEDTKPLTAFWWNGALWQYNRAPFGLKQLPQMFQERIDYELHKHGLSEFTKAFLDDVLIVSRTFEEHCEHVRQVLEMFIAVGLKAHPDKSLFCSDTVEYLGFDVSRSGLTPNEAKVRALLDMSYPRNLDELRSALGKLNYYSCFCESYSALCRPLLDLLKKGAKWEWDTMVHGIAFDRVRNEIATPGKALQRFDPDKPIFVHSDFSNVGLGAVLAQHDHMGREAMVACISRSLNKHESNYSSYKGECLAAVWAVKMFKHFLHGKQFTLVTDHQPLKWLMGSATLEGAHARWACILQEFDFDIVHRPGSENANADALSRMPLQNTADRTGARLDHDKSQHVVHATNMLSQQHSVPHPVQTQGPPDRMGTRYTVQLDTRPQTASVTRAVKQGVVLYEPFGGLCAGLEALLRNNITVHRYIYSDISPAAQAVARHRITALQQQYPDLLSRTTIHGAFTTLPMDVTQCTSDRLHAAGACRGEQWVVIAGPPCQDFSPAGNNKGFHGKRSHTLHACMQLIGMLQQLQTATPPLYIIENACMQHNFNSAYIREHVYPAVCAGLGSPITFDAAQCGSFAHRLRNYWQNFAPADTLSRIIDNLHIPHAPVDHVLDRDRFSAPVERNDTWPYYPANRIGFLRVSMPTLVAYPMSRAFRFPHSPGSIFDAGSRTYTEPNVEERERMLGYSTGATAAPGLTLAERHTITGNCIDQSALSYLIHFGLCHSRRGAPPFTRVHAAHHFAQQNITLPETPPLPTHALGSDVAAYAAILPMVHTAVAVQPAGGAVNAGLEEPAAPNHPELAFASNKRLCRKAQEQDKDIHHDAHTLEFLRTGRMPANLTPAQMKRVTARARRYRLVPGDNSTVHRIMHNGATRIVPAPPDRRGIIEQAHVTSGHFGIRRTLHLMLADYWWQGIWQDVTRAVNDCKVCDRVKASFNACTTELQPLPIMGLFYRWGVDLCGPFPETKRGNRYVMVMIEHFSKTLVLEPLPSKESKHTAYAFEHGVLGRFGSCAELISDNGSEFMGELQTLCVSHFIDHRTTSANHPQADGLAERAVQTVKRSIRRHCEDTKQADIWDRHLNFLSLGYNCSKQASTNVSPYQVLYAREPQFPSPALSQRMAIPVKLEDPQAAEELVLRGEYLKRLMPTIANNLAIAQHRDKLRYAQIRSGTYLPMVRKFTIGDFVYVRNNNVISTLQVSARQIVARILELRESGVVILQGKCGQTMSTHVSNIAPCHLPHLDGTIDPDLAIPPADHPCEVCRMPDAEEVMLLCDWCNTGWHTYCLEPPLADVPEGDWLCPHCVKAGVTTRQLQQARSTRAQPAAPDDRNPEARMDSLMHAIFANATKRSKDTAAAAFDGCIVSKRVAKRGKVHNVWGTVQFRGADKRPKYFHVCYDDNTSEILTMRGLKNRHPLPKGTPKPAH